MSENCDHNCSGCASDCEDRTSPQSFQIAPNKRSNVKKIIGVVSGKGGVGKSLVTSLLTTAFQRKGKKTAILDADVTGPSIPKVFGVNEQASSDGEVLFPVCSKKGTKIMSVNLLLENDTEPVIWRGPVIANTVKQFWSEVAWGDVDYMFVDMPPGTGDVPLTVFQSLPLDGIVIVTSPQELVGMIVAKAVNMANAMDIPVLGIVENMSYYVCPSCEDKHYIFGDSHIEELAKEYGIDVIARIPIDPELAKSCDRGEIEDYSCSCLDDIVDKLS